ncbi:MAG: ankyrin repeat domain-containing protein [Burkholderiales bacterium]
MKRRVFLLAGSVFLAWKGTALANTYDDFLNAVKRADVGTVTRLLRRGMDANTVDPTGQPALHLAARYGSLEVVKTLVAARADIDRRNAAGESAVMLAALAGHLAVVEFLVGKEAQINHPGWTPLIYAAANGHRKIVEILLENHAYIDSSSSAGITSLMMAARGGHLEVVKFLIEEGADVDVKNDQDQTAADWAELTRNTDIAKLIRAKMKPPESKPRADESSEKK